MLFSGFTFVLDGPSLQKRMKSIIENAGGTVKTWSPTPVMFRKANAEKALGGDVKYVVVASTYNTRVEVGAKLYAKLDDGVEVVHESWVSECLAKQSVIEVSVHFSGIRAPTAHDEQIMADEDVIRESSAKRGLGGAVDGANFLKRPRHVAGTTTVQASAPMVSDSDVVPMLPKGVDPSCVGDEKWQHMHDARLGKDVCMYRFMLSKHASRVQAGQPLKLAGFDMDWTIIQTKTGKTHPVDADDWCIWRNCAKVKKKLRALHDDGYAVVVLSNQGRLDGAGGTTPGDLQRKIENIQQEIGVPFSYLASMGTISLMRKPCTGMWDWSAAVLQHHCGTSGVDMAASFFVGDAAGRPDAKKTLGRTKDFSDSDYTMARNAGVRFLTPEHFFEMDAHMKYHTLLPRPIHPLGGPDARGTAATQTRPIGASHGHTPSPHAQGREIRLLYGPPACGKTTLCARRYPSHHRINQDTLGSISACLSEARRVLTASTSSSPTSIIVDNTNLTQSAQEQWNKLGQELDIPVTMHAITGVQPKVSMHLSIARYLSPRGETRVLSKPVIFSLHKLYNTDMKPGDTVTCSPFENDCAGIRGDDDESRLARRLINSYLPDPPRK